MQFNSVEFLIFLPIVISLYYGLPHKFRWILLLVASYFFYMSWKVEYAFLIMASTGIDYWCGIKMGRIKEKVKRRPYLLLSLISNLGLLFSFKYLNFSIDALNGLFTHFHSNIEIPYSNLLLPVGISFYTFQTLSYSIEVYQGKHEPEKHLGIFALYVSFFPQLVAGPIERFIHLGPQFRAKNVLNYGNLSKGFRLILFGLFVKMVIADNLSGYVEQVYNQLSTSNRANILTAMFFYSYQIYADFYGYSLIAIGSARLMGIDIMDNFKAPYLSRNIAEFWQRWHISLSTWFRDYVYIPLGGNRVKIGRWTTNILVVFTVSGLWHGANYTFLVWGAIFGIAYLIESMLNKLFYLNNRNNIVIHACLAVKTFIITNIAWVFFRSSDMNQAIELFKGLVTGKNVEGVDLGIPSFVWVYLILFIISDFIFYNKRIDYYLENKSLPVRWGIYGFLIFSIIVYAGMEDFPFIYFQF